jgi:hypothetical protein
MRRSSAMPLAPRSMGVPWNDGVASFAVDGSTAAVGCGCTKVARRSGRVTIAQCAFLRARRNQK